MLERIVVINDASIAKGGATGLALVSLRGFRARSIPVTMIVGDAGDNPELAALGVDVVALGDAHILKRSKAGAFLSGISNSRARDMIARWIKENDSPGTVYHVHGWSKILSPSIFSALRPVAARTYIHAHDFFMACPNGGFMDYQRNEPCYRKPLGADCITTNCDKRSYAQKTWRMAREVSLWTALGNAGDWAGMLMIHEKMRDYFVKSGYPDAMLRTVRNPASPFTTTRIPAEDNSTFFIVGRVEPEKGVEDVVAAAGLAGVPLEVIGDGPLMEPLAAAHPEIKFHGWSDRAKIASLLTRARAVIMASRYPEPFGLVVAETSTSGLPLIVSRTAFLAEEVVEQGLGLAAEPLQPEDIAACMREIAGLEAEDIRAISERAFSNSARLAVTEEEWVDELIGLYRAAAGAAPVNLTA